jgi:hypothetical protein
MNLTKNQLESLREMLADLRTHYFEMYETGSAKTKAYVQEMLKDMASIEFELNLALDDGGDE